MGYDVYEIACVLECIAEHGMGSACINFYTPDCPYRGMSELCDMLQSKLHAVFYEGIQYVFSKLDAARCTDDCDYAKLMNELRQRHVNRDEGIVFDELGNMVFDPVNLTLIELPVTLIDKIDKFTDRDGSTFSGYSARSKFVEYAVRKYLEEQSSP